MDKFKDKSEEEWKKSLTSKEYHILREKGTEEPFTGEYLNNKKGGTYVCRGCGAVLFSSDTKFDSGTGWPSFSDVVKEENVLLQENNLYGMKRTEVTCANCGGHLGHVFPAGPKTLPNLPSGKAGGRQATGKRYCINSTALDFKEK